MPITHDSWHITMALAINLDEESAASTAELNAVLVTNKSLEPSSVLPCLVYKVCKLAIVQIVILSQQW